MNQFFELLERRLATLNLLATDLESARDALTGLDVNGMHQHITYQEILCRDIRFLDREIEECCRQLPGSFKLHGQGRDSGALPGQLEPAVAQRLQAVLAELSTAQGKVQRLNRVQAALLRRSRRSVNVLMNFMANYSATYAPPQFPRMLA